MNLVDLGERGVTIERRTLTKVFRHLQCLHGCMSHRCVLENYLRVRANMCLTLNKLQPIRVLCDSGCISTCFNVSLERQAAFCTHTHTHTHGSLHCPHYRCSIVSVWFGSSFFFPSITSKVPLLAPNYRVRVGPVERHLDEAGQLTPLSVPCGMM